MNWKVSALLILLAPLASGKGLRKVIDADQDGLPDSWERRYFVTAEDCAPDEDPDGDGISNMKEFLGGFHPLEAAGAHGAESGGGGGGGGALSGGLGFNDFTPGPGTLLSGGGGRHGPTGGFGAGTQTSAGTLSISSGGTLSGIGTASSITLSGISGGGNYVIDNGGMGALSNGVLQLRRVDSGSLSLSGGASATGGIVTTGGIITGGSLFHGGRLNNGQASANAGTVAITPTVSNGGANAMLLGVSSFANGSIHVQGGTQVITDGSFPNISLRGRVTLANDSDWLIGYTGSALTFTRSPAETPGAGSGHYEVIYGNWQTLPEPGGVALGGAAALVALARRRRR